MLLGPSGCGKTTTLRMIAGLELPSSGQILLDGQDVAQVPADKRDIAFVFQMFALYPHMNVRRNIAYPLVSQGMGRAEVRAPGRGGGADPRHHRRSSTARSAGSRAATGSGWRSGAPSCASRRRS